MAVINVYLSTCEINLMLHWVKLNNAGFICFLVHMNLMKKRFGGTAQEAVNPLPSPPFLVNLCEKTG